MTTSTTSRAPAPSRATVSLTLNLGLVSIPVSCYTGTEDPGIVERHQYVGDDRVGQQSINKTTGEVVTSDQIATKVTVGDTLVELTDEEIAAVTAGIAVDRSMVEVQCLVPLPFLSAMYVPTKRYQMRGDKKLPAAQKAFRLLLTLLDERGQAALIKFAMRGAVARYAALSPDGTLQMLHFDNEVREALPIPGEVTKRELEMGRMLLDSIPVDTPPLANPAADLIADYLTQKAKGKAPKIETVTAPSTGGVDLMAALEASIAASKKPAPAKRATKKRAA